MISSRVVRAVVAAGAAATLLAGCGQGGASTSGDSAAAGEPQQGGSLRWGYVTTAPSLDPAQCGTSAGWQACQAIYGTLMNYDPDDREYEPAMAEALETEDGRVWTLKLRPDVQFTDGTPFDAEAVAFNWERLRNPENRSIAIEAANAMQWKVIDAQTLEITLPEVNYKFPTSLHTTFAMIASPTALQQKGQDFANSPVGAGPFTLASWTRGTEMKLVRNENYWDDPRPYLDELTVVVITDEQQRLNAVKSGEIDINSTQTQSTWESGEKAGLSLTSHPYLTTGSGLRFNGRNSVVTNADLRGAIARAINTQQINDAVHSGAEAPKTIAMPTSFFYDENTKLTEENLDEGQKLLDKYLQESGQSQVTVRYTYITGIPMITQEAQVIKAQVERLNGITVELVPLDLAVRQTVMRSGDYDMIYDSIGAYFDPDSLYARYHSDGADNTAKYDIPELDAALEKTRQSQDDATITEGYKEALKVITEQNLVVPWMTQEAAFLTNGNVGGILPVSYQHWQPTDQLWIEK